MRGWFLTLAACAALAEIARTLAPPGWREHIERIAALAALAVLLVPLGDMAGSGEVLTDGFESLLGAARICKETADAADTGREAWTGAAELVFRTAEELGIDPASMTVTFREEAGVLCLIDVTAPHCPWNLRAALEEELEEYFGVGCTVSADAEEGRRG